MHLFVKTMAFVFLIASTQLKANEPDIDIQQLNEDQEKNVRSFLSLTLEKCQSPEWRIKNLFTKADKEINKALRALGYYQVKINKQLTFANECWQASFNINAGEPVRVNRLSVQVIGEAEQEPAFKKLLADLPIKQGDILNHGLYEKIKQDLHSLSLEFGYLKNQLIKKSLQVNPEKKLAEIELILDSGPRHHFGKIIIEQNVLNPDFVKRFLEIKPNDYYSTIKLAKTYNTFSSSLYFSSVDIKPKIDKIENNEVPVNITLTAEKKHHYSFGLGYDTDIGPLASVGYQNHFLNRSGHNLSIELDVSPVLSGLEASYMIPFTQPRTDHFLIGLGFKQEDPDTFKSDTLKLSFQYQHIYPTDWKQVLFLDLSYEDFTISNNSEKTILLVPGSRWQYKESNHALRPTQGHQLNFSLAGSHESVLSGVSFLQITAAGKMITSLPWYARLITRIDLGATLTDDFSHLPVSYRFFSGGTETIRGYEYKALGPIDNEGEVIGGKILTVISAEYEQFINESWGIAAFIDSGNAYNPNNISIKSGAGLGVRWVSPIGPIRLDFAVPLNGSEPPFQIHFSVGTYL